MKILAWGVLLVGTAFWLLRRRDEARDLRNVVDRAIEESSDPS